MVEQWFCKPRMGVRFLYPAPTKEGIMVRDTFISLLEMPLRLGLIIELKCKDGQLRHASIGTVPMVVQKNGKAYVSIDRLQEDDFLTEGEDRDYLSGTFEIDTGFPIAAAEAVIERLDLKKKTLSKAELAKVIKQYIDEWFEREDVER